MVLVTNEKEIALLDAGLFLRDDTEMRKEWDEVQRGEIPAVAYSFCRQVPFERICIFAGSKSWAIDKAYELFQQGIKFNR